jgi:hypothetical protein
MHRRISSARAPAAPPFSTSQTVDRARVKKQIEPAAMARLVVPPRWHSTRAGRRSSPFSDSGSDSVRTSAKASRSTLSGLRPAAFTAATIRETIDSRAATRRMR